MTQRLELNILTSQPLKATSHVAVQNVAIRSVSLPVPGVLLAAFWRTADPNFTGDTALPWVLGKTLASAVPVPCLFGMRPIALQLSCEPLIQTTSDSTLARLAVDENNRNYRSTHTHSQNTYSFYYSYMYASRDLDMFYNECAFADCVHIHKSQYTFRDHINHNKITI